MFLTLFSLVVSHFLHTFISKSLKYYRLDYIIYIYDYQLCLCAGTQLWPNFYCRILHRKRDNNNFRPFPSISILPSALGMIYRIKLCCVVRLKVLVSMATLPFSKLKFVCAAIICPAIPSYQFLFLRLWRRKSRSPIKQYYYPT